MNMLLFKILASLVLMGGMVVGGWVGYKEGEPKLASAWLGAIVGMIVACIPLGVFSLIWFALPA